MADNLENARFKLANEFVEEFVGDPGKVGGGSQEQEESTFLNVSFDDEVISKESNQDEMTVEENQGQDNGEKQEEQKMLYKCGDCSYSTKAPSNLYRHRRSIHEKRRFECELCSKAYGQKYFLNIHIQTVHQKSQLLCDKCSQTFNTKQGLARHVMSVHDTAKSKYKCNLCNESFYDKNHYTGHVNKHMGIKPFTCEKCKSQFTYKQSLLRHVKTCNSRDKEICQICSKEYKSKRTLQAHMRGVHGSKDKKCVCGRAFSWSSAYAKHKKSCKLHQ